MPNISKILVTGLLAVLIFSFVSFQEGSLELSPERQSLVMSEPYQGQVQNPEKFTVDNFLVTPLATFRAKALVLSARRYRFDSPAKLSPVDLALGWSHMADPELLSRLTITQRGRWYRWRPSDRDVNRRKIEHNSANMHMIPSTEEIRKTLLRVRKGDIVSFAGYLVRVDRPDGWNWVSSLTRTDTGNGACEIVWLQELSIIP